MAPPRTASRLLDEPVDIFLYLRHVLDGWRLVAGGVIAGMLAAGVYTLVAQPLYRSTLKLMVVPARLDQAGTSSARLDPLLGYNFLPFVRNADALTRAVEAAGLTTPENRWKMANFGQRFSSIVNKDAPIIELTLDFPDADAGSVLISKIADEAIKLNREMLTRSDQETRTFLKGQLDASLAQLRAREEAMQDFLQRSHVEQLRKEADGYMVQSARLVRRLQEARLATIALERSSETMARLLADQKKLIELRRTVDPAAGASESAAIVSQEINPLLQEMEPRLVEQRSALAAADVSVDRLVADLKDAQSRARTATMQLNQAQLAQDKLKLELDVAREAFKSLSERYDQARISVAANSADLRIFEQPRSGGKVSPRPLANIVIGAMLGAFIGMGVALAAGLLRSTRAVDHAVPSENRVAGV